MIKRDALVEENACKEGLEFFDTHFPAGEGTQEAVFEALAKYAPTTSWQAWLAGHLGLTATCRSWYTNGTKADEAEYVDGNVHGMRRSWYSDDTPGDEEHYVEGKIHGLRRAWHYNGELWVEETYVYDILHGLCRYWYTDGKPCAEETFEHGRRNTWRSWDCNGNPDGEHTCV